MTRRSHRHELVHKRVFISHETNALISLMAELMPTRTRDELVEAAILYGLAYINETNKLKMAQWMDTLTLPTIDSVDEFLSQKA